MVMINNSTLTLEEFESGFFTLTRNLKAQQSLVKVKNDHCSQFFNSSIRKEAA